jgi:Ca2+-binding EF-hand superfamily protein
MQFKNNYLYLNSFINYTWNKDKIINNINVYNANVTLSDNNIKTGNQITIDNENYEIVLLGDVNKDGLINSGDLLKIVKYLKGYITLNDLEFAASDLNSDKNVNSADLLKVIKYLKNISNITI